MHTIRTIFGTTPGLGMKEKNDLLSDS